MDLYLEPLLTHPKKEKITSLSLHEHVNVVKPWRPLVLGLLLPPGPSLYIHFFWIDVQIMALNLANSITQTVTKRLVPGKSAEMAFVVIVV